MFDAEVWRYTLHRPQRPISYEQLALCCAPVGQSMSSALRVSLADAHTLPSLQSTTGALVLAKNLVTARQLAQQFQTRTVSKTYLALVRGGAKSFPSKYGEIREALEINEDGRVSIGAACDAKFAATDWELIGSSVSRVGGVCHSCSY